ncbi:hypothetical protein E3Q02_00821 [Wallemia mellicola]|uniref:Methyltransferase domain-containing protein n=1 Tax=Wallemia mellicola TaxID=1708541 RepID=A0AB38N4G3_9BASI|nr:hypothetical protein E3Q02_00821 [Wallemia mellicola]
MTEFWNPVYWDNRFRNEREFEWLVSSDCFVEQTKSYIASAKSICNIGCGNSNLSASIRYSNKSAAIHNLDYSSVAIERSKELNKDNDNQHFYVVDLLKEEDVHLRFTQHRRRYSIGCGRNGYKPRESMWVYCSYSPYRLESLAGTCNLWTVTHEWSIIAEESSAESNVHRPEIRHYFVALERM